MNVPNLAPRINGIAFFRLINLDTVRGTSKPIVMFEEKTAPVKIAPIKYVLYFDLKCLFTNFLAFLSPPRTSIIDFPKYFKEKIKIAKAIISIKKLFSFNKLING